MTLPEGLDIALYLNISFYAILGMGLVFGFLRGFKNELFAFLTTVLFYVAFFLTIDLAVEFLWNLQIPPLGSWLSGFVPELSGITQLSQAIPILMSAFLEDTLGAMVTNEQLLLLADGLGIFVLKLVWTLLYFTIIFVVYKLLCGILRAIFMPKSKLNAKYASKNRGLGALFGLLGGAVSVYVSLIMLGGIISISASLVSFIPDTETEPEEVVLPMPRQEMRELSYSLIPLAEEEPFLPPEALESLAMITDFVEAYQGNTIVQIASQLTMSDPGGEEMELTIYLFDEVLSFNYQANALDPESPVVQVSLRKELTVFAEIAAMAIDSGLVESTDLGSLTSEQIVGVFDKLAQSDLVTSLLPLGIEFAAEYSGIDIELPREDLYAMDWGAELENLGVIAASLYEIADLAGAFEPEGFDYETVTLSGDTVREFFTSVSESELITLAAFVAVAPLLEMANLTAIVTVPADMDWAAEFVAIGAVLGEIVDSGITVGDVTSQNYVVLLQAVAGINFELILDSKIMTNTLINILSGNAGIEELNLITVPAGTIWLDQLDNEGNVIANGELRNILLALEALLTIAADAELDFEKLGEDPAQLLSVIGDLNMDDVDTIFGSAVLVATLSDLLMSQDLGTFDLVIPDSVLDENGYILKTEFVNLVNSAKVLSTNLACTIDNPDTPDVDEEDTECMKTGIDINKALSLESADMDTLLNSDILSATVGHLLYTMTGAEAETSVLVVPDDALGDIYENEIFVACVSRDEIKRIFKAVKTLGIESIDDIEGLGASTLNEIDLEDDPETTGVDESLEIGDLVASIVIRATITNLLKTMDLGETVIVVPDAALETDKDYLSAEELENTVRAIKLVIQFNTCDLEENPDCQEIEFDIAAVLDLTDPEINTLLASRVIKGTIGKYLLEMPDILIVPDSVQESILVDGEGLTVVTETEIRAIFKAVRALGMEDFEGVDFDASIIDNLAYEDDPETPEDESEELDQDKLDDLFGSIVLRATITDLLTSMDLGGTVLVVPDGAMEVGETYLTVEELTAAVKAMKLVITTQTCDLEQNPDCQAITFEVATVLNLTDPQINTLLASQILKGTIGKYLLDMPDVLIVPDSVKETVDVEGLPVTVVKEAEIRAIFKAVRALGMEDFEDVDFDASIIDNLAYEDNPETPEDESEELDQDKLDDLFGSIVLRATITDLLTSMDLGGTVLVVPDAAMEVGETYLTVEELTAAVKAMKLVITTQTCDLEVDPDCEAVSFEVSTVLNLTDPQINTLLASQILKGTIGKYLLDMPDVLIVPDSVTEDVIVDELPVTVVKEAEIRAIFKAVRALGMEDFEDVDFDASIIDNLAYEDDPETPEDESEELDQDKLDDLFGSIVLRATITDLLTSMDLGGTVLVVPHAAMEVGETYLTVEELTAAVKAMKLVITTQTCDLEVDPDCEAVTFEVSTVLDLSDSQINTLLASQILRGTIGKYLLDMPDVLTVPGSVTEDVIVDELPVTVVKEAEIRAVFKAVRALGMENFEDVGFDASIINNLSMDNDPETPEDESEQLDEDKLDDLFGSAILRATVTDQLTQQSLGETSLLVPDSAKNVEGYLTQTELEAVARSLKLVIHTQTCDLEVDPDCVEVEFAVDSILTMTDGEITTLLDSEVLAATIGSYVHDMDSLVIPSTVIVSVEVEAVGHDVVETDEIHLMLSAVSVLGFTTFDGFTFDATVIQNLALDDDPLTVPDESVDIDEDKLETLFDSLVIRATMSDMMIELTGEGSFVVIPEYELDELALAQGLAILETVGGVVCISETELEDVLRAIFYLDIDDLDTLEEEIDLDLIIANIDVILLSSILQSSITQQLLDTETNAAGAFIIPDHDEDGVQILFTIAESPYLTTVELAAAFHALEVLGIEDITDFGGSVDLANVGEGNNAQTLVASAIIQATVSQQVNDLDTDGTIIVPDLAPDGTTLIRKTFHPGEADEIRYIAKLELEHLLLALDVLGLTDDVGTFGGEINLKDLYDNKPDQDTLLESVIIHATITDQVLGLSAVLVIPDTDVTGTIDLVVNTGGTDFLDQGEIEALINALGVLYPDGVQMDGFEGDFNLKDLYDDSAKQDKLLLSASVHATISDQILGLGAALVIPETDVTGAKDIKITQGVDTFIFDGEIKALINALGVLYPDGIQMDGFEGDFALKDLYDDADKQDKLLLSASVHATISDQILGLGAALVIPETDVTGAKDIKITQGVDTFIFDGEIKALINALGVLYPDGIQMDGFQGDFELASLYNDSAKQDKLLLSASIHATISDQILGLGAALVIPETDVTGVDDIKITQGLTTFVFDEEIKDLINALGVLYPGGIQMDGFEGDFALKDLYDNAAKQDKLLLSASIHATISDQILGLGAALVIPETDVTGANDIKITQGVTTFVWGDEIKSLINALGVLYPDGIQMDGFEGDFALKDLYDDSAKQDKLLLSASIHATISDQILGLGAALTVPATDVSGTDTIRITQGLTTFVFDEEIKSLINALGVLYPDGIQMDGFQGNFELASLYNDAAKQDKLLLSASIHATISDQILGLGGKLTVPSSDASGAHDIKITQGLTVFVWGDEIKSLINAIGVLFPGGGELDGFSGVFALSDLYDQEAKQDKLLLSASIHATLSEQILGLAALVVPETAYDGTTDLKLIPVVGDATFVQNGEIKALINALGVLFPGGMNLDDFDGGINLSSLYDNNANQTKLLLSASIHATISDQILDIDDAFLLVPETDVTGTLDIQIPIDGTTYLLDTEIKHLINALKLIGFGNGNLSGYAGTISLDSLIESTVPPLLSQAEATANQNKLLESAVMQATIAKTLLDLPDDVLIVPDDNEAGGDLRVLHDVTFLINEEIRALIDGFGKMGFTDLDNFGASISSSEFFDNRDLLLLSVSMQATISDKMLNDTGEALVIPDAYRVDAGNCTLILKAEIEAIMDVLEALDLTNFAGMTFNPAKIFTMEPSDLLASGSMRATISKTLLTDAANETVAAGYAGLIIPRAAREIILVDAANFTQVEQVELLALVTSLRNLGVADFGDDFNPAVIMLMDESELNDFLDSGSIHITMHKMISGNTNLMIPAICEFTMYPASDYPIASVITKSEMVDFIQAVQKINTGDFTDISFDAGTMTAIQNLGEADRSIVLESYIVRYTITETVETLITAKNAQYVMVMTPQYCFNLDAEDYEAGYDGTLLTHLDSVDIFKFLNDDHDIID